MSTTSLLLLAASAIATLVLMITWLRVHPFVALVLAALGLGLATGMAAPDLLKTLETGMGATLGHVALIIPLGAMIGKLVERSGGASALATTLTGRAGSGHAAVAVGVAAYVIGIPVFFEVGVVLMMPILYGLAGLSRRNIVCYSLPACSVLLIVHGLLPPHPGALTSIALLGADTGRVLAWGLPITALAATACWPAWRILASRNPPISDSIRLEIEQSTPAAGVVARGTAASTPETLLLVLLPIVLILAGSALPGRLLRSGSMASSAIELAGTPAVALLLTFGMGLLQSRHRDRYGPGSTQELVGRAIQSVALVILVTGAGGAFAKVLVASGVGTALANSVGAIGLPVLALGFAITLALRAIQGPTTVALVTTAGILQPFVRAQHLDSNHLALLCIGMGCGGIACSHVNDAGFWIYTRLSGLSVRDGLRTWTLGTTVAGVAGLALTSVAWWLA